MEEWRYNSQRVKVIPINKGGMGHEYLPETKRGSVVPKRGVTNVHGKEA
jgi:hypothetical protein